MKEELYQIILPYAVFGITVKNNKVVGSAPIGKWLIGENLEEVKVEVIRRRGKLVKVNNE